MKSKPARGEAHSHTPKSTVKPEKIRLDVLIVARGLAPSRQRAQALLLAGQVRVNGTQMDKAGSQIAGDARVEIAGEALRYSSRGGLKLEGALQDFGVTSQEKICLDVGSSTGGFTDCLLQHGARRVYAIDVTTNQLDWKLQQDKRVVMVECNARYLQSDHIGEAAELVVMDVSFISAAKVLPAVVAASGAGSEFLILIKPQFELEKRDVGKGGIVRDPALHQKAIDGVLAAAAHVGLEVAGVHPSHLTGTEGNQEFFLHAHRRG
jgi:23S rRNA (cytidine1920-2'-O)/16S rRNA (cytidine1409-2'-O)-methyltransferase